jgi:hypothetical protein
MLDGQRLAFLINRLRRDPLVTEHCFAVRSHSDVSQFRRQPPAARGDHRAPQNGIRRLRAATDIVAGGASARPTGVSRDFGAGAPRDSAQKCADQNDFPGAYGNLLKC